MKNQTKLNRNGWAVQLALTTGLTLLFLVALLWGLHGVTPARADPGTLYVDGATGSDDSDCSNPADPCATIGYALSQAGNGDEIRVAGGTYTETVDILITVTLKGGYAMSDTLWLPRTGETIVDGNGADEPVIAVYPRSVVTVDGFIVQGANHVSDAGGGIGVDRATAVVSGTVIRNNAAAGGGGVAVEKWAGYPGSLLLVNSSILTNTAGEGGGLVSYGWPTVTLDNVEVRGNTAQNEGGGLYVGRVTITNSAIVSNTAVGRGGGVAAGFATIYNSEISNNKVAGEGTVFGGGVSVHVRLDIWDSTVSGNRLVGEESIGGGIDAEGARATIVNTIVSSNSAQIRGGVTVYGAILTMTNSLLIGNTGDGLGGRYITGTIVNVTSADNAGMGLVVAGPVTITNSIVWGNEAPHYSCTDGCSLTYSDVGDEEITGTGNIFADPLFVDAANGDYHLELGSPCIDRGTPVGAPVADIEGTPRDATPDIGAYEWAGFHIFLPLTLRNVGL
jgi:hypothetical protein